MRPPSLQEVQRHLSTEPPPPAPSAPTAAFTGSPLSGTAPLTVTFDGSASTGPVDLWEWDVGDGAGYEVGTSTRTVTYTTGGDRTVKLRVRNLGGIDEEIKVDYVSVDPPIAPPVAFFVAEPTSGPAPLVVQFTNLSTGPGPLTYFWDFGDGHTSTEENPTHTYT